ncbi:MAG: hypothetical protein V4447_08685 [Pseudomonadota bacterium]
MTNSHPPVSTLSSWIIVSQVKSNRIVYFTDDMDFQPAMDGDWYFISHYQGALPDSINLRNCWRWKFNGHVFTDMLDEKASQSSHERLMESNRKALLSLLKEKINLTRQRVSSQCNYGFTIRSEKLEQATLFLENTNTDANIDLLKNVGAARGINLEQAAHLIVEKAHETRAILNETEYAREKWSELIREAETEAELIRIRENLLTEVYPNLSVKFPYPASTFSPENWDVSLKDTHKKHEVARLKTQLQGAINKSRSQVRSVYLVDDVIRYQKVQLAQKVLNGEVNTDGSYSLIENYATVHGITTIEAAQRIVATEQKLAQVLVQTEIAKDKLEAKIDSLNTLRDIEQISLEIRQLENLAS